MFSQKPRLDPHGISFLFGLSTNKPRISKGSNPISVSTEMDSICAIGTSPYSMISRRETWCLRGPPFPGFKIYDDPCLLGRIRIRCFSITVCSPIILNQFKVNKHNHTYHNHDGNNIKQPIVPGKPLKTEMIFINLFHLVTCWSIKWLFEWVVQTFLNLFLPFPQGGYFYPMTTDSSMPYSV